MMYHIYCNCWEPGVTLISMVESAIISTVIKVPTPERTKTYRRGFVYRRDSNLEHWGLKMKELNVVYPLKIMYQRKIWLLNLKPKNSHLVRLEGSLMIKLSKVFDISVRFSAFRETFMKERLQLGMLDLTWFCLKLSWALWMVLCTLKWLKVIDLMIFLSCENLF